MKTITSNGKTRNKTSDKSSDKQSKGLETEHPISEKDEVKRAETRLQDLQKKHK